VRKRKVTWDQLIELGLAKPATKVSIHGAGVFTAALAAKKADLKQQVLPVLPEIATNEFDKEPAVAAAPEVT